MSAPRASSLPEKSFLLNSKIAVEQTATGQHAIGHPSGEAALDMAYLLDTSRIRVCQSHYDIGYSGVTLQRF